MKAPNHQLTMLQYVTRPPRCRKLAYDLSSPVHLIRISIKQHCNGSMVVAAHLHVGEMLSHPKGWRFCIAVILRRMRKEMRSHHPQRPR